MCLYYSLPLIYEILYYYLLLELPVSIITIINLTGRPWPSTFKDV